MASVDKLEFLSPPVLNVALDPQDENDLYIIKCIADSYTERIEMTNSYDVLKNLAQDLVTICDVILSAGNKKSPGCANNQEPF